MRRRCENHVAARRAAVVCWAMLCVAGAMGCSSSDAEMVSERADGLRRPGDARIVPQTTIGDEIRPLTSEGVPLEFAETTYSDGSPTHYADGSAAYHVDGSPVDYRPRNIQREMAKMPTLYIRDVGQPRLGSEGPPDSPTVEYLSLTDDAKVVLQGAPNFVWKDPATGDTCWRALTCENPQCVRQDGAPLIFAALEPALLSSSSSGKMQTAIRCPRCGHDEDVAKYHPPATSHRIEALRAELARLRAERRGE